MTNKKRSSGFTIIFAILVGSLLVSIGIAITNLALKELSISSLGRESQIAFYTADGGIECALYWDIHGRDGANDFSFASPDSPSVSNPAQMICGNRIENLEADCTSGDSCINSFELYFDGSTSPCSVVTLKKTRVANSPDLNTLDSIGINDCSLTDNPSRVRRLIRVEYY